MTKRLYAPSLLITVFSDASVKDGKAGYGYWFKSAHASSYGYGDLPTAHVPTAELQGICAGMRAALQAHADFKGDLAFVVQCDNLQALGALIPGLNARPAKTSPHPIYTVKVWTQPLRDELQALRKKLDRTPVYLKHVKGHRGTRDARSAVNTLTDRLARKGRSK